MAAQLLPATGVALQGAPDSDIGTKEAKNTAVHVMRLDMTQDIVDELLDSVRSGKAPQILFGRAPQLKFGDKTHVLQTSPEHHRYELYQSTGTGEHHHLAFAGLINHKLAVQKAEEVTAGVDSALEQLKSSMAAISEMKEANKTIVGNSPSYTPSHRRFPSKTLKSSHLNPSSAMGSPMHSKPSSPAIGLSHMKHAPTSQPTGAHDSLLKALRTPVIHLLAVESHDQAWLLNTVRCTAAPLRELLPKIAKADPRNEGQYILTDKSYKELNPFSFKYRTDEERQKAIDNAVKAFDRLRLAKDDALWQILLPKEERGKGKCLSRLNVQAPVQKASTPMQKISKYEKKPGTAKKTEEKDGEKESKKVKEPKEPKVKKVVKAARDVPTKTATTTTAKPAAVKSATHAPDAAAKPRTKKPVPAGDASTPRVKPKTAASAARDVAQKERVAKPYKPTMPVNTKPKNPSPLSASPPVNASDFEESHPVHKALSGAPSPAKTSSSGNSDRSLKRKANDIDSDIHSHNLSAKQPRTEARATPTHTPINNASRLNGSTPSSANSLKRKGDNSAANTPSTAPKIRKVIQEINTGAATRYTSSQTNHATSPGDSSSTTSPTVPSLSFRQTVELSQKFEKYYKRYEELHWKLAESPTPPSEQQRQDLMKMRKKLEEMKREIQAGAGVKR